MGRRDGEADADFTFDTVVELLEMLDGSDLPTRIVYENGPLRLEVERCERASGAVATAAAAVTPPVAQSPPEAAPASPGRGAPTEVVEPGRDAVTAPIAGVFYRAPSPGAAPFIEIGQRVGADDPIGIIEVMKLMNTVRAGIGGTVVEICVDNEELVEFEQVLVRIEPEG